MVGNSGDGGNNLGRARGGLPGDLEGDSAPVLGEVSDAELDAFVSKLRTDKNRISPAATQPRSRGEMLGERLHRSRPRVSSMPEAGVSHAWYVALDAKASGPYDLAALKGYWERGELGAESLCWRDGLSAWLPLCQVPELAEVFVPLPQERLPTADEVPVGMGTHTPGFELKGAEVLRSLTPEPVVGLDAAGPTEMASGPLGAPASGALQEPEEGSPAARSGSMAPAWTHAPTPMHAQGGDFLVGGTSVDSVGAHAVLGTEPTTDRGASQWRRAVWLALLGGVAAGVTVTLFLGGTGTGQGRALLERLTGREAMRPPGAPVGSATPIASASTPSGNAAPISAVAGAAPGTVGTGAGPGAAGNASVVDGTGRTAGAVVSASPKRKGTTVASGAVTRGSALALEKRSVARPPMDAAAPDAEREVDAAPEENPASALGPDEDFERELADPPTGDPDARKGRTVYVPPDPTKPAASLAQSDIFNVVLANKGDISACATAQRPPTSGSGGRVVLRWSILPSGRVGEVVTETASLQGTPLARCIEGKVRAWTFPKHQVSGGPVRFPFVF